jgi:glycerol-3-phosphate dehydrogenase
MGAPWTDAKPLPGGDFSGGLEALAAELARAHPYVPPEHLMGMARRHGTKAAKMLAHARGMADLGEYFGAGLYSCEISHMVTDEWAVTAEDVLWRRSKCGLMMSGPERDRVAAYLAEQAARIAESKGA